MVLNRVDRASQASLRAMLQGEKDPLKLENLAAAMIGRLLGVSIAVAKSGFQHGGDAGPAGRQGRRFRIECKKYSDTTALSERELLGEIDQALARDQALEAWILVATRDVPEQLEQSLSQKGESVGIPVLVLDWKDNGIASLAALCASAPKLVNSIFSPAAGALAEALKPAATDAIHRIGLELKAWGLGFETLRTLSLASLDTIWQSPRASQASIGQNAAGGAENRKVRRATVHSALDGWWSGPAKDDAPIAVVGYDGVGKTWAALDWLVDRRDWLPIVLVVPSSAAANPSGVSETAVRRLLADRLYELAGVRDRDHWLRRLDRLLQRPIDEGPVIAIFLDGLNQEPSTPWLMLLKVLQGQAFEGRVRVMISTRLLHFEDRLSKLRGLVVAAATAHVDLYDANAGGELDQMLGFEELTRADLHPDLVELARTPRLFRLVVRFRERLVDAGQITVHRLLWEYGRDSFGDRAGKSFSESEWRGWLREIAGRYRDGVRDYSLKALGETASRPDLSEHEVYARLSDIIDGRFTTGLDNLQLVPMVVAHALGAALLSATEEVEAPTFDSIDAELSAWLDPVAGLDQRAEILRAAVSILIERGEMTTTPIAGVLVTAWLQTQNIPDGHRRELAGLAMNIPDALLDAIEHSETSTHSSARLWAVNALRAIRHPHTVSQSAIITRARVWLSVVSRGVWPSAYANADIEKNRSDRFLARVGIDASGPLRVLGLDLQLVDWNDGVLAATVPSIIEHFPLADAVPAFEAAAIALAVAGRSEAWEGLKWLSHLNQSDPDETATRLQSLANAIRARVPEPGIASSLPDRVASLLLRLAGDEEHAIAAVTIDPALDRVFTYEKDYLPNPGRSLMPLERRHAKRVLVDTSLPLLTRIQRCRDLLLDPMFQLSASFVEEVSAASATVDVEKLDRHGGTTSEDHIFEQFEPALARCAPELLAQLVRRKMQSYRTCPTAGRYWSAISATESLLLAGDAEGAAARQLRLSARQERDGEECYAASQLLIVDLHSRSAIEQAEAILSSELKYILTDLDDILKPITSAEAELLITRFGAGSVRQRRDLIVLLSRAKHDIGDLAWSWIMSVAGDGEVELHGFAYHALEGIDATRFGHELNTRNWGWSPSFDFWVNHYGSGALVEATVSQPFDQIVSRVAPWRLLEVARRRGEDPSEVRLAASIFGRVLTADVLDAPDLGSALSVERTRESAGHFVFSVTPTPAHDGADSPLTTMHGGGNLSDKLLDVHRRAAEVAAARVQEARAMGADLYLANAQTEDMEAVYRHAPDLIAKWLEGSIALTSSFKRRVRLAEAAYLALCEALLIHDPTKGTSLWRCLRQTLTTRFIGNASVDEMIHIALRAPDTPAVQEIWNEIASLDVSNTDQSLLNLAIAATSNGRAAWLSKMIEGDMSSGLEWRRRRGMFLKGFTSYNALPVAGAWPEGEIRTEHEQLRRKAARLQSVESCARYWWRAYWSSVDSDKAYASWLLFLRTADRRAWIWVGEDAREFDDGSALYKLKSLHWQLNRGRLRRAMEKREDEFDKRFLDREIVDSIGPWASETA